MASKDLSQLDLPIGRRAKCAPVDVAMVQRQPNKLAALNLCIQWSGLEDKEIFTPLGLDSGQWSRIRKGDAHFPPNLENALMDVCGNEIPLIWAAWSRGQELRPILSTLEQQLAAVTAERDEAQHNLRVVQEFMRGKLA